MREDKLSEKLAEVADLESEWREKRIELERKNEEIRELIETLDNPT